MGTSTTMNGTSVDPAPPASASASDGPTFVVQEGPGLVQGTVAVTGRLCTADDVAALLDELTSLAAVGVQEVTLDLSAVTELSDAARDAMLELAVEASPAWLTVRLDG